MDQLGIFEAKNKLSEVCERVAVDGTTVVVTRHGKPLVRIVPYQEESETLSVWGSVEECQTRYGPLTDEFDLPERSISENRDDPLG